MSIGKKKDGRVYCQYYIKGKTRREFFGRGIDAEKAAQARDNELKAQGKIKNYKRTKPLESKIKFADLALEYLSVKAKTDMTTTSSLALEYKLAKIILPSIGHIPAMGLTYKKLDEFVKTRIETQRTVIKGPRDRPRIEPLLNADGSKRYISRSTVHRELCDIQAVLNWGVDRRYLIKNPVRGHKKPKRDDAIIKPPTQNETLAIINESAPHLIRALKISFFTGLRPGASELFRLTWDDVVFVEKTIFIISAKKNGIPFRTVPLHHELFSDLKTWEKQDQDQWKKNQEKVNPIQPARQLITYRNKPIQSVKTAFKSAKRRAGIIRRIRLYDFRHAAITNMLSSGGDLKSISEIAGHSRTDTTTKIYHHTSNKLLKQQIDRLPFLEQKQPAFDNEKIIDFRRIKKTRQKKTI